MHSVPTDDQSGAENDSDVKDIARAYCVSFGNSGRYRSGLGITRSNGLALSRGLGAVG